MHLAEKDLAALIRAVQDSDVTRFDLVTPDFEIHIARGDDADTDVAPLPQSSTASPEAPAAPAPVAAAPALAAAVPAAAAEGLVEITAPMIGIFYTAPEPGADPFVALGSTVEAGMTVGLVEAMKLFTAVEAGAGGIVEQMLVSNGDYVEFGQPLVRLRPTA
ncbi:MAG TPA: acetyl-CoA carboxylase biotin carboxyl carrier protein [Marmoricola sp.]|nr:acetyl-CoA carboxylase biotin carboxyl carrier protein [Marmoricola sp.]